MRAIFLCAAGLSMALGAAEASAAADAPSGSIIKLASGQSDGRPIHDLGLLPPPATGPSQAPSSASTVSGAEPVPELPTWAMMLLCLAGLAFAGFKKGRKNRLSPGIE